MGQYPLEGPLRMSVCSEHQRPSQPPTLLPGPASMSLLSWGKETEGANGTLYGQKGKSAAGKGGVCDFWGRYDRRA